MEIQGYSKQSYQEQDQAIKEAIALCRMTIKNGNTGLIEKYYSRSVDMNNSLKEYIADHSLYKKIKSAKKEENDRRDRFISRLFEKPIEIPELPKKIFQNNNLALSKKELYRVLPGYILPNIIKVLTDKRQRLQTFDEKELIALHVLLFANVVVPDNIPLSMDAINEYGLTFRRSEKTYFIPHFIPLDSPDHKKRKDKIFCVPADEVPGRLKTIFQEFNDFINLPEMEHMDTSLKITVIADTISNLFALQPFEMGNHITLYILMKFMLKRCGLDISFSIMERHSNRFKKVVLENTYNGFEWDDSSHLFSTYILTNAGFKSVYGMGDLNNEIVLNEEYSGNPEILIEDILLPTVNEMKFGTQGGEKEIRKNINAWFEDAKNRRAEEELRSGKDY